MPEYVVAGNSTFIGGQNDLLSADKIEDAQYSRGINVTTKNGNLSPRWGYSKINIEYPEGGIYNKYGSFSTYKQIFEGGKYQASFLYYIDQVPHIVCVMSGHIFALNLQTYKLFYFTLPNNDMLNSRLPRVHRAVVGKYAILFDGISVPIIIDGYSARRSRPFAPYYEVPVASMGCYNHNRLFISNFGSEFTAGDPTGAALLPGPSDMAEPPLTFQEIMIPGASYVGQIFQLSTAHKNQDITAMHFLQVTDTSTGVGPLVVATNKAVYTYASNLLRANWQEGQFGSVLLYNTGIVGPRAVANVNSDMFFMSADGHVRTLSMCQQEQKRWANVPISMEVDRWLKCKDQSLLKYSFVGSFKNHVFFSANPFRTTATDFSTKLPISDYAHLGLVVLELDNISSFGEVSKPSWAGLWLGLSAVDFINTDNRAFIVAKENKFVNAIYEVNPDITYDTFDDRIKQIKSCFYSKEFSFGDPYQNKRLHSLDATLANIKGDFRLDVSFKPSHSNDFLFWRSWQHSVPWNSCNGLCDAFINGFAPLNFKDFTLGEPAQTSDCNLITQDSYDTCRKVQLKFLISGIFWELLDYRVKAIPEVTTQQESICSDFVSTCIAGTCDDDWMLGEEEDICQ